jgi:hypothetical protein
MKRVAAGLALILGCLGLIALAVFGLGDTSVLVPPPEAAAESFLHQLATHRYARALPLLEEGTRKRVDASVLRRATEQLERGSGRLDPVHGEAGAVVGPEATAGVRTSRGKVRVRLVRQHGLWRVKQVEGLPWDVAP